MPLTLMRASRYSEYEICCPTKGRSLSMVARNKRSRLPGCTSAKGSSGSSGGCGSSAGSSPRRDGARPARGGGSCPAGSTWMRMGFEA